jgi:type 2 lantibiotic biosynthesis protein LanM
VSTTGGGAPGKSGGLLPIQGLEHSETIDAMHTADTLRNAAVRDDLADPALPRFLDEALDRARTDRELPPPADLGPEAGLLRPLWPFLDAARDRFVAGGGPGGAAADRRAVWKGAHNQLATRLLRLAGRALTAELAGARARGVLRGTDGRERFEDFLRRQSEPAAIRDLFARQPVLGLLIARYCLDAVLAASRLAERFAADRDLLATQVLEPGSDDPGMLAEVRFGLGDPHAGGQTVCLCVFEDGRQLMYKPRPLGLHAQWNRVLDWLAGLAPQLASPSVRVLPRDGYGWAGFVPTARCATFAQVGDFYARFGAQLALLYVLKATDIHAENVLAAGEYPVLVDVETLLHPLPLPRNDGFGDPAALALDESVLRIAALPTFIVGENGVLDISALGALSGQRHPDELPVWADAGTDLMRLARGPVAAFTAANRPRLADGALADPSAYVEELLTGFRTGYRAVQAHLADWLSPDGLLAGFCGERLRVVARPSQMYANLLAEANDPVALRDPGARERAFAAVSEEATLAALRALAPAELADLMVGDIPVFTATPESTTVRTARGADLRAALDCTPISGVERCLASLSEADLHRQEGLIRSSFAGRCPFDPLTGHTMRSPQERPRRAYAPSLACASSVPAAPAPDTSLDTAGAEALAELATSLGDRLIADAYRAPGRMNWAGLRLLGNRFWSLGPAGAALADGYGGIALFLAELGRDRGTARHLDAAADAARALPMLVLTLAQYPEHAAAVGPGGYRGVGGVAYAVSRLATLLDDDVLRASVPAALRALGHAAAAAPPQQRPDVEEGLAGALLAARAINAEHPSAEAAALVGQLAEQLAPQLAPWLHRASDPAERGFARGVDGLAFALGHPVSETPEAPTESSAPNQDLSWCQGLAGLTSTGSPRLREHYLDRVARLCDRLDRCADHSYCHGLLGVLDPLATLSGSGDTKATALLSLTRPALAGVLEQPVRCGTPDGVPTPGLLPGLAGTGYGLLRLASSHGIPSILHLSPAS